MIMGMNISLLVGLIFPPIIFALVIYLTSPYKSIDLKRGFHHIAGGITSILLLSFLMVLFPNWDKSPIEFFNTFFFIAPREELVKLLVFLFLGGVGYRKSKKEHPIATMFYMGMVGLGFAMYENIQYVIMYGKGVLGIRIFTATIAHMLFGLFMGYWMAKGNIDNGRGNRSVMGVILSTRPLLKRFIYVTLGWLSAVGYHGLWNYNLMVSHQSYMGMTDVSASPIMIMLLFFGLVGAKFAHKDLNDSYRNSFKNNLPKHLTD
jgi:RsiW-degrading membrane proteinase PrsW (M82 family)